MFKNIQKAFYIFILVSIFINRILLNEYYSGIFNDGYFYLLFCKDFEQHTFSKHMAPILHNINMHKSKVLDFGSGPGIMSPFFINYVGIDTDKTRIQIAKHYFPNKEFKLINYISESNPYLPFSNGSFDLVLFNDAIHHISDYDMWFILLDIKRILKPNGKIIIREPSKDTNIFTYFITEFFENGDYSRKNEEYNALFRNYQSIHKSVHFEYVRNYYVNVYSNNIMQETHKDVDIYRITIKYFTIGISLFLIYKTTV